MANERQNYAIVKLAKYLYKVKFRSLVQDAGMLSVSGKCTSYIKDGKLYRNLDWNYDEGASFNIICPDFKGMAFLDGLTDTNLDSDLIEQLPYHVCDGVNNRGIMVATHVLFNDWNAIGKGSIPLTKLPYLALTKVESMETIKEDLDGVLNDLKTSSVTEAPVYLIQVIISDGKTTCLLRPKENSKCEYEIVDISMNPKLTNFRWVDKPLVVRENLQKRPSGVERWNLLPCDLSELRFTKAYEAPNRLSEFIGVKGSTKDSSDDELMKIYKSAHELYSKRKRDGSTWHTMHSVVYSPKGMEHLWIQEDWEHDYVEKEDLKMKEKDILEKYSEEVLAHHGVLGMKWGVRRYQNPDGTLTTAGKKRYKGEPTQNKVKQGAFNKIAYYNAKANHDLRMKTDPIYRQKHTRQPFDEKPSFHQAWDEKPKDAHSLLSSRKQRGKMSEEEIDSRIHRLEKEVKLKDLEKKNKDDGKIYAGEILKDIGKRSIVTAATGAILYGGKVLISKGDFSVADLADAVFRGGAKKK